MKWLLRCWITCLAALAAIAQTAAPGVRSNDDPFRPLAFLVGEWVGEGGGGPGQGSGEFSFHYDLQQNILIRKNWSEYPAQNGRAAYRHDDLMIVYREGGALRAIYFDNENHVIRYAVESSGDRAQFLSEAAADQPRYRLTYRRNGEARVSLEFDIAPPGHPDRFQNYLRAAARRKGAK